MKRFISLKPILKFFSVLALFVAVLLPGNGWGQTIVAGSNTITCGTSYTFFDNGGAGGNYTDNQYITYTICPSVPGQYVSVTFSSASLLYSAASGAGDHVIVLNGSGGTAPIIDDFWSLATINNGPTITSSAANGCLTFIFESTSVNGVSTGWAGTATCTATAGTNSPVCSDQNCQGGCGTTICGSGNYSWSGDNATNIEELNTTTAGCLSGSFGEMCNTWYYVNPETAGTVDFNIVSNSGGDQDFAVWQGSGTTLQCPIVTGNAPIRCNFASMNASMTMPGTGVWGPWDAGSTYHEASLTVTAADLLANVYYMVLVNTYNSGGACPSSVATITFGGTAMLSCTPPVPLPIGLTKFNGIYQGDRNLLTWETNSESNNDYFTIERSRGGPDDWEAVGIVKGAGNSTERLYYHLFDNSPNESVTYYRLKQTDFDGKYSYSDIISISNLPIGENWISKIVPNPASENFNLHYNSKDFETPVNIRVYDYIGRIVKEVEMTFAPNNKTITIPTTDLLNGLYKVIVSQNEKHYSESLIIHK